MANSSYNSTLDCPTWDDGGAAFVDWCVFWLEGVLLSTIAVLGILGNVLATVRSNIQYS